MPDQNGEAIKTQTGDPGLGSKGIEQTNENLAREDETQRKGATRQGVISKLEEKLRGAHPEWPDDQVKTVATRMFEAATSKQTGASSGEANEDERGPENEMKKAAPAGEYHDSNAMEGNKGVSGVPSMPKGLTL